MLVQLVEKTGVDKKRGRKGRQGGEQEGGEEGRSQTQDLQCVPVPFGTFYPHFILARWRSIRMLAST